MESRTGRGGLALQNWKIIYIVEKREIEEKPRLACRRGQKIHRT